MAVERISMQISGGDSSGEAEVEPADSRRVAKMTDAAECVRPQARSAQRSASAPGVPQEASRSAGWPEGVAAELGLTLLPQGAWPKDPRANGYLTEARPANHAAHQRHRHRRRHCPPPAERESPGGGLNLQNPEGAVVWEPKPQPFSDRTRDRERFRVGHAGRAGKWRRRLLGVAAMVAALSAAVAGLGQERTVRRSGHESVDHAVAALRSAAALWVVAQVSRGAIVACDPAMCAALRESGLSPGNTLVLRQGAADPLGSDVVVATVPLRNQFGGRLSSVYAPAVLVRFGSGIARIDIRVIAPDGASAYRAALSADLAARKAAAAQLLSNTRVSLSARARHQLAQGEPDSRLLLTLAALAALWPVQITEFGSAVHGATPGMPLRNVTVTAIDRTGPVEQMLAFLRNQRAPFEAASANVIRSANSRPMLRFEFAAPSPLGLLNTPGFAINAIPPHNTSR